MTKILLSEVRDWLKTFNIAEHYYSGNCNTKKEKSIGVYDRSDSPALAGVSNAMKTKCRKVSILVHWTTNADDTEKESENLREAIENADVVQIGNHKVDCKMVSKETFDAICDSNGIYERVIWLDIYYDKNEIVNSNTNTNTGGT